MSSSYSANQYDGAFKSQRLQNWCETKHFNERPTAQEGHTTFIANDRGHLLPGVIKKGSAWPDFQGTWDLPARIPAPRINPTGRSVEGLNRLRSWGFEPQHTGGSQPHRGSRNTDRLQDVGEQTEVDVRQDGAAPSPVAEDGPAPQSRPVTGGERAASRNQDSRAEKQALQATERDRPLLSQCSAAAGEGTSSRPGTGQGRPASHGAEEEAPSSSQQRHRAAQQDP